MAAPYATAAQLASAVRVNLTPANTDALELCIDAASAEIDHECDRPAASPMPEPTPPLANEVCIARALEWWKANDAAFGVLGFDNTGVLAAPRDGFARHVAALLPLKLQFGIGVMGALADLRERVAAALEPLHAEWAVHAGPVDSITPPAFVLVWPEPWLTRATACHYRARVQVIAAAARIDPTPGYEQLEQMVAAALPALAAGGWPLELVGGAIPWPCGAITYQAARITVSEPVTLEGG